MSEKVNELIDVLDEQGKETGQKKDCSDIHRDGDWHKSFHLWIIKENSYVLLQRRSEYQELEPNKLAASFISHFFVGDTLLHMIDRIDKYLGLKLELKSLQYLDTYKTELTYPNATDREFQEVYVTFCDKPLNSYYLDYKEVFAFYEVPIDKAIEFYRKGVYTAVAGFDAYQRENNALLIKDDLSEETKENIIKVLEKIEVLVESKIC